MGRAGHTDGVVSSRKALRRDEPATPRGEARTRAGGKQARSVTGSARVELPAGEDVVVVVVADTHSQPHARAHALIAALAPRAIVHAGDIGDLSVLDDLSRLAPVHAVRGNIDGRGAALPPDTLSIDFVAGATRLLRVWLTHIAVYGPKLLPDVASAARAHDASLVICGHSHVPFIGQDKGLSVFNPGSVGPRRFQLPITFGVLRFGPGGVKLRHVSCETGQTWSP
jgi:putative phosphoesterase